MGFSRNHPARISISWEASTVHHLLFLVAVLWIAHFFCFRSFGLYEDDYAGISRQLSWDLSRVLSDLQQEIATLPQGRPIGFFLIHFLAFLAGKIGGLRTAYIFGFLVQVTNVCLFYFLIKKISLETIAFIGALAFGLFPADTTHIFLTHSLGLHTSLTFLLIASLLYLSGKKILSYLFALGSLLTYESPYMVFLAIPLLGRNWDYKLAKEMGQHLVIWLAILVLVALIRFSAGEVRVVATVSSPANIGITFVHAMEALVIGPAISLEMFRYVPGRSIVFNLDWMLMLVFAACLPPFFYTFNRMDTSLVEAKTYELSSLEKKSFHRRETSGFSIASPETGRLLVTSLIMLSLAYGLSFTHFPPTARFGRMTSVHLAAAFGGSLFFACLCSLGLSFARSRRFGFAATSLLAVYFSLLVVYRFSIQVDFKKAWLNERAFWSEVIEEAPDLTDGTIVFVLDHDLPATRFIMTNSWADPEILAQIFQFPVTWRTPPRLFVVSPRWTDTIVWKENQLQWEVPEAEWSAHQEALPDANVILLEMINGKLARRFGSLVVQGHDLKLKPLSADRPALQEGVLYRYLLAGTGTGCLH